MHMHSIILLVFFGGSYVKEKPLLYKEKFDSIAINQWQRIQDYLATKKINK